MRTVAAVLVLFCARPAFAQAPAPAALALEARVLVECEGPLRDMALDPKGNRVFTLTKECVLTAWNRKSAQTDWRKDDTGLWAIECGDKVLLATMGLPTALTFALDSGAEGPRIGGPPGGQVYGFAADARGRWVWIGVEKGLIRLTPGNVDGWSRRELANEGVTVLALDEDGDWLAAGGKDGSVRFANCKSANVDDEKVLSGTGGAITALAFGPRVLVAAAADGSVRVWDLASNKEELALAGSGAATRALAVAAKPGWIASADEAGTVVLWSLSKGTELGRWKDPGGAAGVALAFPDAKTLLVAVEARVLTLDLSQVK